MSNVTGNKKRTQTQLASKAAKMNRGSCRFGFNEISDVVVADASDAAPACDFPKNTSCLSQYMSQQTLIPLPHPAYGLMHLAGNLKDDNHFCAAAQAMVSAIEIAMGHEERQSFALQLMWMLKTTLDMGNVEIIVHGIPTLCDDVPSLRGLYNDRDSVSYLGEYSVKASADNNSAGNDNGMPPLVCSDNGDDTSDAIQDSVD